MPNDVQTTSPIETLRASASDRMVAAAAMTLHQLVDEFVRLSKIIDKNVIQNDDPDAYGVKYTPAGTEAIRDLNVINGASRIRFGVQFQRDTADF